MEAKYDDNLLDYWILPNGIYKVKIKKHDALDCDNDVKNTLPSHFAAFVSKNGQRIMKNFIRKINRFYNNSKCYGETDSFCKEKNIAMFWISWFAWI